MRKHVSFTVAATIFGLAGAKARDGQPQTDIPSEQQMSKTQFTRDDLPPGCMISLAATHVAPALDSIRDMAGHRALSEATLAERLRKGVAMGDLPPDTNVEVLAAFYSALARGIAVQARDGATRERLAEIAEVAMRAWPKPERKTRGSQVAAGGLKPVTSTAKRGPK